MLKLQTELVYCCLLGILCSPESMNEPLNTNKPSASTFPTNGEIDRNSRR